MNDGDELAVQTVHIERGKEMPVPSNLVTNLQTKLMFYIAWYQTVHIERGKEMPVPSNLVTNLQTKRMFYIARYQTVHIERGKETPVPSDLVTNLQTKGRGMQIGLLFTVDVLMSEGERCGLWVGSDQCSTVWAYPG